MGAAGITALHDLAAALLTGGPLKVGGGADESVWGERCQRGRHQMVWGLQGHMDCVVFSAIRGICCRLVRIFARWPVDSICLGSDAASQL
jgi:hypothetical protein